MGTGARHRYVLPVTSSAPRASAAQIRVRATLVGTVGAEFEVAAGSGPQESWTALAPGEPQMSGTVVYLDLNHWVTLSGAKAGLPRFAASVAAYEQLRSMLASGRITIVLCGALYREVAKIGPFDRRVRLADVMGELTSFRSVASLTDLVPMEFAFALNRAIGRPMFPKRVPVFGVGAGFASGRPDLHATLRTPVDPRLPRDEPLDALEGATLDEVETESRLLLEYGMLRGPGAVVPPGFDPGPMREMDEDRLARELELRDNLLKDPVWRDRLDDIVAARCLYGELGDQLPGLLDQAGLTVDGFFDRGKDFVTRIIDDVPVLATENLLRERNHRDFNRTFKGNDIYDSDALRVAVPYCDIVVTDRDAAAAVKSTGAATRYGTVVLSSLEQLVEHLRAPAVP